MSLIGHRSYYNVAFGMKFMCNLITRLMKSFQLFYGAVDLSLRFFFCFITFSIFRILVVTTLVIHSLLFLVLYIVNNAMDKSDTWSSCVFGIQLENAKHPKSVKVPQYQISLSQAFFENKTVRLQLLRVLNLMSRYE